MPPSRNIRVERPAMPCTVVDPAVRARRHAGLDGARVADGRYVICECFEGLATGEIMPALAPGSRRNSMRMPRPVNTMAWWTGSGRARNQLIVPLRFPPCRAKTGAGLSSGVGIAYKTPIRIALSVRCVADSLAVTAQFWGQINSLDRSTGAPKIPDGLEL